jgi:cytochrome c oxidase subunit II
LVDSSLVLWGQTLVYTLYCVVIILLVGWFAYRVTKEGKTVVNPKFFYGFVTALAILGVSLHLITMQTIPWVNLDLNRDDIQADKTFNIIASNQKFTLPSEKLVIDCGDKVLFNVESKDLTYGFGLFREDNSMLFQIQVVPGHRNDVLWHFEKAGIYTIRSTEYSGPAGIHMMVENAVQVLPCGS